MMDIKRLWQKICSEHYWKPLIEKMGLLERVPEWGVKVALEIGAASIKAVQLRETSAGQIVEKVACRDLPGEGEMPARKQIEKVSDAISQLWQEDNIEGSSVRLVISDPEVYLRQITIPQVGDAELSKAVRWQAEKYVPFPIENAIVDYQNVGSEFKNDPLHREIIIVAVDRTVIDEYVALLRNLQLTLRIIDLTPFATARAVIKTQQIAPDELVAILDIASRSSTLIIVGNGSLVLVRTVEIGGKDFAKKNQSTANELNNVSPLGVDSLWQNLANQMELCFAYCEREFLSRQISKTLLCGGGANALGLVDFLTHKLGVPVEIANPFQGLQVAARIPGDQLKQLAPRMTAVVGEVL